jgi:hypothetical protein
LTWACETIPVEARKSLIAYRKKPAPLTAAYFNRENSGTAGYSGNCYRTGRECGRKDEKYPAVFVVFLRRA